ncbi:MAG: ribonuclease HI [Clostridiaceae bacterium]
MKEVIIYTDGACRGNGKEDTIGGFGIVFIYNGNIKEIKESYKNTTNNKMELMAVIKALSLLKEPCSVSLYSDSAYVVNAVNSGWIESWQKNNWKNSKKEPVKNRELWEDLIKFLSIHRVTFIKVKGHSDNEYNNRCDKLANMAMDEVNC